MDEILRACPTLGEALKQDPSLERVVLDLAGHSLGGVFIKYLSDADPPAVSAFLRQAGRLDHAQIQRHRRALAQEEGGRLSMADVAPVHLVTLEEQQASESRDTAGGLDSLADGMWASVAFAGGAGTRFFSHLSELDQKRLWPDFDADEPKGRFPISPVGGICFYEYILAEALDAGVRTGRLPWVLFLTSMTTGERTRRFLDQGSFWGFPREWISLLHQSHQPRLDPNGDLIVADDAGNLSWTGDGHGGVYRALLAPRPEGGNFIDVLRQQGIDQLVMHNVDNAASRPFHPARLGFHLRRGALFTLSAVRKTDPSEQVGLLMRLRASDRVEVVEYNVLDQGVAAARDQKTGRLLFEAANVNTNLIALEAVQDDFEPTLYRGKQVLSRKGPVQSSSLEMLNQHITRLLDPERVFAFEVDRREFFMPTKNVTGVDSAEMTARMLSNRFARLLEQAGAQVHPEALCDLHPAWGGVGSGLRLEAGCRFYLGARQSDSQGAPICDGLLTLQPESRLSIHAALPYGGVRVDGSRRVEVDASQASRLKIGRGVVIEQGVQVGLRIGPGARLTIPAGRVICRDLECELGPGEDLEL